MFKTQGEKDEAIRRYAAGQMSWPELQRSGLENFLDVLWRLGELGLRPPVAPLQGPNADLRRRARAIIAERLRSA